jgi:DNA repair photolyase
VGIRVRQVRVRSILTRTSGYLREVCSHSLQPYRGCSYGRSLCGAGCYVRHHGLLTRGEPWGSFLDARVNAAERYAAQAGRERRWARRARGGFAIFMSSTTDPFVPQEQRLGITQQVLRALCDDPPDALILQSHSHLAASACGALRELARRCALRVQLSVESDRERLPGLPAPASSVEQRLAAAAALRDAGLRVVITVAPLLPIERPEAFFRRIAQVADACVIDHFIGGDGSPDGSRTARTELPAAMARVDPESTGLAYRERMVAVARRIMPGRVGVGAPGFAGHYA